MSQVEQSDENVSVVQAYQDGETYNQVSDLLKGIVKQDQIIHSQSDLNIKPVASYVSERSPVQVVKVKVPKIDYTGLQVR